MSSINNVGFPEIPASSNTCFRPPSSLSLPSNSYDSGFLPSGFGSSGASATNSHTGISSASGNTSVGSSPIPTEQDIDQILHKAVELLTLRSQALKQSNAASQITDTAAAYYNGVSGFFDFPMACPTTNSVTNTVTEKMEFSDHSENGIRRRQQINQLRSKYLPPVSHKSPKPESYKTVMCQAWLENGICSFGENCRFAHGEEELRPTKLPTKNPKYKTKLCDKYTMAGLCPYGDRCLFIHPEATNAPNPYIRPDRYLKMQRERAALLASMNRGQLGTPQTPLSSRATNRPPPSWPLESPAFFSAHRDLDQLLKVPMLAENFKPCQQTSSAAMFDDLNRSAALNDITNQAMVSVQTTPTVTGALADKVSGTANGSPDSGISATDAVQLIVAAPQTDALITSDYPFQVAIHTDNLARSLACEFKVD